MARKNDPNLEGRLALHAWANSLLGYADTREMLSDLGRADEGFDGEGRSGVLYRLRSRSDKLGLPLADLERYDENVRRHLDLLNRRRPEPVTLRYFQHLAALYAEIFLDRWSSDRDAFTDELNAFAGRLDEPLVFEADDVDKLAFWMATGSGVIFVEPHGMRNDNPPPNSDKVDLYLALEDLSDRIAGDGGPDLHLDSYVVSATPFHELKNRWGEGWTRERFARKHVLFEDDLKERIPDLLAPRDRLERRVSATYPPPLATGFRSLTKTEDPREIYQEQLRFAENLLAFLGSVSLALVREDDREEADLDLAAYWRGGISPGDWRDIIRRCSKIFVRYDDPLATAIRKLKIQVQTKGFGRDMDALIRAKNDFKHDRDPKTLEDTMAASDGVRVTLTRCMGALDFLANHPMLGAEDPEADLFLETGGRLFLFPFLVPEIAISRHGGQTYFVDAWDTRKGVARMKSFERGETVESPSISEALTRWGGGAVGRT